MWNLCKCNCWVIIGVILRNALCNNKVYKPTFCLGLLTAFLTVLNSLQCFRINIICQCTGHYNRTILRALLQCIMDRIISTCSVKAIKTLCLYKASFHTFEFIELVLYIYTENPRSRTWATLNPLLFSLFLSMFRETSRRATLLHQG